MTRTTFIKALHKQAPGLISDIRDRDHGIPVAFDVKPELEGVRLIIALGDEDPRELSFANEDDAAKFLGRTYKSIKLWEAALSLLSR